MNIKELHKICCDLVDQGHGDKDVVFDTEAQCFNVHLVSIKSADYEPIIPETDCLILTFDWNKEDHCFKKDLAPTPQDACNILNEALKLDYDCILKLITYHEQCNDDIAAHPTIQVRQDVGITEVGFMGLLNGIFGIRKDWRGYICYEIEDGKIMGFKMTP